MPDSSDPPAIDGRFPVLALVRDLMFASRVTSTANQLGIAVKMLREAMIRGSRPGGARSHSDTARSTSIDPSPWSR